MNRLVCIILAVCMMFTLSACGNDKSSSEIDSDISTHSVDVAKVAASGKISDVEILLGDPVDNVKDVLFQISAGMTHDEFCENMREAGHEPDGTEYDGYVIFNNSQNHTIMSSLYNEDSANSIYCMYTTNNKEAGISAIAVVGDAFDFDGNTLVDYVKGAVDAEYTEAEAESDLYFLPKGSDGATCLTYELGAHKLELYFSQYHTFVAAVLYDTNLW